MITEKYKIAIFIFLLCGVVISCTKDKAQLLEPQDNVVAPATYCDSVKITYAGSIQPIIQTKCLDPGCHGLGYSAGDLLSHASVKVKITNGSFKERTLVRKDMPSPSSPLSLTERKKIQCWLDKGAPDN